MSAVSSASVLNRFIPSPRRDLIVRTPRGTPPVAGIPPGHISYVTDQMNRIKPMPARLLNQAGASRGYIPDGHRRNWDLSLNGDGLQETTETRTADTSCKICIPPAAAASCYTRCLKEIDVYRRISGNKSATRRSSPDSAHASTACMVPSAQKMLATQSSAVQLAHKKIIVGAQRIVVRAHYSFARRLSLAYVRSLAPRIQATGFPKNEA
ncbi:hypothetical protein Bbelb_053340 [Branchiostoma belcheri]|nr:hypothetical protein Bbelb_053340 [Branchiostoma belcheri]